LTGDQDVKRVEVPLNVTVILTFEAWDVVLSQSNVPETLFPEPLKVVAGIVQVTGTAYAPPATNNPLTNIQSVINRFTPTSSFK
jgi:ABC-type nitrate/sulfonate/bicarbonate transport system permease component